VRVVVGFVAGGPTDVAARVIAQWLSERLGQPFVIENRLGAGSNLATEAVVRAPADGYTLLVIGFPNAINATLYHNLNFNFIRDFTALAGVSRDALVLVVHPSVPASTVPELIAYAKARPGQLSYGSGGVGVPSHLAGEFFKTMTGINMVQIPYRGAEAGITALLGGQVQVYFASAVVSVAHAKDGELRALAVTTVTRLESATRPPDHGGFPARLRSERVDRLGSAQQAKWRNQRCPH
jgi:tripartite-type tricarboxylate transporter receptor subunit TctC